MNKPGRARWRSYVGAIVLLIVAAVGCTSTEPRPPTPVDVQLLVVSDWHGQLDPLSVPDVGDVGGAAVLSSYWKDDRVANPNSLTLTAGDGFGGSPALSSFFSEEPAVLAMNLMGFDADTLGNHSFDRGIDHLRRMIDLAEFQYVAANLQNRDENLTGVKDFELFDVDGVKVAVIGLVNPEAPTLVRPGNFGTIQVTDPVEAANRARAAARQAGATVLVVLTHMGLTSIDPAEQAAGPLIDFANAVSGFDVILGDHTDVQFEGTINDQLVVENRSRGRTYSRIKLRVDPRTGGVLEKTNEFVTPRADAVTPDKAIVDLLAPRRAELTTAFDQVIGVATAAFPRDDNTERLGEAAIGNLIADAIRLRYGTQLAFVNGGGIRAPLPSSYRPAETSLRRTAPGYATGPPFDLVVGDVFTVQPFVNEVVTREVTGALLYQVLEHSVAEIPNVSGRFAQISGFRFAYDSSRAPGSRVTSVTLDDGTPILADQTVYTLATHDFVNSGGDGYTMLADGQGTTRELLSDVLLDAIRAQGTITPTVQGRITNLAS